MTRKSTTARLLARKDLPPLPDWHRARVVVAPPGQGPGGLEFYTQAREVVTDPGEPSNGTVAGRPPTTQIRALVYSGNLVLLYNSRNAIATFSVQSGTSSGTSGQ